MPLTNSSDWGTPGTIPGPINPDANLQLSQKPVHPPKYLSAQWLRPLTRLVVLVTVGNGGIGPTTAARSYNLYFVPATQAVSQVAAKAVFDSSPPFVTLSAASGTGNVTYQDTDHLNIIGWYVATAVNANGDASAPCTPAANIIDYQIADRVQPPEAGGASVQKSTVTESGSLFTDTIYTLAVTPITAYSLQGYQIYIKGYNNDPTLKESIFIPPLVTVGTFAHGTVRLPTDSAGHTIYFYFVALALDGSRRPDPQNSTFATIASGP